MSQLSFFDTTHLPSQHGGNPQSQKNERLHSALSLSPLLPASFPYPPPPA